jgi:hypothetical protein
MPADAPVPRLPGLGERELRVDHHFELPVPHEPRQHLEVRAARRHEEILERVPRLGEHREERELVVEALPEAREGGRQVDHLRDGLEHGGETREGHEVGALEDHVVFVASYGALIPLSLGGPVVQNLVGSQAPEKLQVARSTGDGHMGSSELHELHEKKERVRFMGTDGC